MKLRFTLAILLAIGHVQPVHSGIGSSLKELRKVYGQETEICTYRPDLYATSYEFLQEGIKISATLLPDTTSKIDVFFQRAPSEDIPVLLKSFSGVDGWRPLPTSDATFTKHYPLFDPKRGDYYVAEGAVAFVQKEVGLGKLVLWIEADSYQKMLQDYRSERKQMEDNMDKGKD